MIKLSSRLPAGWKDALAEAIAAPSFQALQKFLAAEDLAGAKVLPPRALVFAALEHTPLDQVKVVILGQDPYPTAGVANGLSFSVSPGVKIPPSLKNIFLGLEHDLGLAMPKAGSPNATGDLSPWAKNGVLLLNTVLTVREGKPHSHKKQGWEPFTEAILKVINAQTQPVVFFCLGKPAQEMAKKWVDSRRHPLVCVPHPSPLAGNAFVEAVETERPFVKINQLLTEAGRGPIDWALT